MRVRVLEKISVYWNYGIQEVEKGTELIGDFARHLLDNAPKGSVEVLEADPPPEPKEPSPPDDAHSGAGGGEDDGSGDGPPVDGTIDDLMTWVGGDADRAGQALAAEQAKDKPRSTVVKRLSAMVGAEE